MNDFLTYSAMTFSAAMAAVAYSMDRLDAVVMFLLVGVVCWLLNEVAPH